MRRLLTALFLTGVLLVSFSQAATYFVNANVGSDNNNGTLGMSNGN